MRPAGRTGGFGSGWLDQLRVLGRSPIAVSFAGKATRSLELSLKGYATITSSISDADLKIGGTRTRFMFETVAPDADCLRVALEDYIDGQIIAPAAFLGLLEGKNFGKLLVKVA